MSGTSSSSQSLPAPSVNPLMPWTVQQLVNAANAQAQVINQSKRMTQPIASGTMAPVFGSPTTVNIAPSPVGIITKFLVEMTVTVTNPSGGSALTRTALGPFNALSNVTYTNPSSVTPINAPGWHLGLVAAARRRRVPGSALTTDSPTGFGSVIQPIQAPASIAANASGTVKVLFEVPLAYDGMKNLQGAVFAGGNFITNNLALTFNPNFCVSGTDPMGAVYTGANASAPPTYAVNFTVYQRYLDQFDLSLLDALGPNLSTDYYLTTSPYTAWAANVQNVIGFANLRTFMSVILAFDNGGTFNAGTDITDFRLVAANQLPFWRKTPNLVSYETRELIGDDFPAGHYLFDMRDEPIATAAEGNTTLQVTPSSVQSGAVATVGWEYLGVQAVLAGAPSIGQ